MDGLAEVIALFERGESFLLTTHLHPDGDGLGSMLALGRALTNRGKEAAMVITEVVPGSYSFLEDAAKIRRDIPQGFKPSFLVALDCGDRERMALPPLPSMPPIINIDHHLSNVFFGEYNLVDAEASATGEVVHRLLSAGKYEMDKMIGTALYVAIATDTGFFRYTNATRGSFLLAAQLVESFGLEPGKIAEVVHEQKSLNAVKLLGLVLDTLRLAIGGTVAWMYMSQEMLARHPVELEEIEGFVNYARSIIGVEIALFFKETREGEVRVSWRSGPGADVNQLAANFGGGGHARAAGCTIQGSLEDAVEQVLTFLSSWQGGKHG